MKKKSMKMFIAILFSISLLMGCSSVKTHNVQRNVEQPIAVQGAMDIEVSTLLHAMQDYKEETHGGYTFYIGSIENTPVVVSRTEIGMVHAAASTAILIENYQPRAIINQGTAGGHDPSLRVFDTVIGAEVTNIGSLRSKYLGDGQGTRPGTWIFTPIIMREENGKTKPFQSFTSDPELVKIALSVADKYKYGKVVKGKVGSSDFWNREVDRIQWFHKNAGTSVEEMEAASVAQVAKGYNIPYLSIRTISNSEVSGDRIEDLKTAGQYCGEFAVEIVKAMGK